jgi:hypothetical protein
MSATVMTNDELQVDFGHLATANRERVVLWFWDDANSNAVRDVDEVYSTVYAIPQGHTTSIEEPLPLSGFDADRNELPDYWELTCGLASSGLDYKSYTDEDCDGLVNLHEYWAGTDPLTPDGSNTLLSVCARSIDDRIAGITSTDQMYRFDDYAANMQNGFFITNGNFWAKDLDFSCVSVASSNTFGNSVTGDKIAVAITRRHVILSSHWHDDHYTFRDANGNITNLSIIAQTSIPGGDSTIGRLSGLLPETICLPKILPSDYEDYIGNGAYLPTISLNWDAAAIVLEINTLDRRAAGELLHYCGLESTNVVSQQRAIVRGLVNKGYSSTPTFLLLGNDLIYLCSKHTGDRLDTQWGPYWGPI